MARVTWAGLILASGSLGVLATQARADETGTSCGVTAFSYEQLCGESSKAEQESPRLLDEVGQPRPCLNTATGADVLARLEIAVDREGRLVRAKLLGSPGICTKACLEHSFTLSFSRVSPAGTTTMQTTTVLCRPGVVGQRASGRRRG